MDDRGLLEQRTHVGLVTMCEILKLPVTRLYLIAQQAPPNLTGIKMRFLKVLMLTLRACQFVEIMPQSIKRESKRFLS